jgi:hypothetical protein
VPCPSCGSPIGFPARACTSCKAVVPAALREALERRLEAADDDFRDGRANVRAASTILLVLALVTLAAAVGKYALEITSDFASPEDKRSALEELLVQCGLAAIFFGCVAWVKRSPLAGMASGFLVWMVVQVAAAIASPLSAMPIGLGGFVSSFLRLVVFLFLVRGLVAAGRGQRLIRKMTRSAAHR